MIEIAALVRSRKAADPSANSDATQNRPVLASEREIVARARLGADNASASDETSPGPASYEESAVSLGRQTSRRIYGGREPPDPGAMGEAGEGLTTDRLDKTSTVQNRRAMPYALRIASTDARWAAGAPSNNNFLMERSWSVLFRLSGNAAKDGESEIPIRFRSPAGLRVLPPTNTRVVTSQNSLLKHGRLNDAVFLRQKNTKIPAKCEPIPGKAEKNTIIVRIWGQRTSEKRLNSQTPLAALELNDPSEGYQTLISEKTCKRYALPKVSCIYKPMISFVFYSIE